MCYHAARSRSCQSAIFTLASRYIRMKSIRNMLYYQNINHPSSVAVANFQSVDVSACACVYVCVLVVSESVLQSEIIDNYNYNL